MIELGHALEALSRAGLRRTPQRIAVIEALVENRSHPTAEAVWRRVRTEMPNISLSTIYATLRELESLDLVHYIADDPLRVDPDVSPHAHLICGACGRVTDVPDAGSIAAVGAAAEHLGHTVEKVNVSLEGICDRCKRQRRRRIPEA